MRRRLLSLLLAFFPAAAFGQCILANPSFEVGTPVGGWNSFGWVGTSTVADHGLTAAAVHGPNLTGWGVSGYWQPLDTAAGDRWEVTVRLRPDAASPLTGSSAAIVNVEWRDSAGQLISYESHAAADASSPTDTWLDFAVTSGAAPPGATHARILLGVLQAPAEPSPTVLYDSVTFFNLTNPGIAERQWEDFPGGRTISFAGRSWRVKGDGFYGPGGAWYSDDVDNVWVDATGVLHLTVQQEQGTWFYTEVALEEALGYGDYVFTTEGSLDQLDPNAVLGLFLWQYRPCWDPQDQWWNPSNEIDIEFSRFGDPANDIAHFTTQPWDWPGGGNGASFDATFGPTERTSHAMRWLPDRVEYRSWRGGPDDESPTSALHSWTYAGPHVPRPEFPRVHLNLWSIFGPPATHQEARIADFRFHPWDAPTSVAASTPPAIGHLLAARPNPFNPRTELRYVLTESALVELAIYDPAGRRVRVLEDGFREAGEYSVGWDGRDTRGQMLASGVYLYRLSVGPSVETRKFTLLK